MSDTPTALTGADIFDGVALRSGCALLVAQDGSAEIIESSALPDDCPRRELAGGTILPGFVDLQINGGGGVMFNDDQSVDSLRVMSEANILAGTVAFLPTLITDVPERSRAAINAVADAIDADVPGVVGIHLEGPHLSVARKGAHDPTLIRPMTDDDLDLYLSAAARLPNVMLTVAPENCTNAQISRLAEAGIIVSLGHSDASFEAAMSAFDAGARCVTHLFNAMSQLGNREPGLVGAALARGEVYAGLIADGVHVHTASIRAALEAKIGADRVFLVTDAMAVIGTDLKSFTLNGREITRSGGRLTLEDGTLAGADLDLTRALGVMIEDVGQDRATTFARATSIPAGLLRESFGHGHFHGSVSNLIYVDAAFSGPEWVETLCRG